MCSVLADLHVNDCLKDIGLLEEFLNENILTKALSADDHIVLGKKYIIYHRLIPPNFQM